MNPSGNDANRAVFGRREHEPSAHLFRKAVIALSQNAAIAEFRQDSDDVRIDADVNDVRLIEIEFDFKMLRVVAEAGGNVHVALSKLSGL